MSTPHAALITGGAGFIGTNLADRLVQEGRDVIVFDDLSRPGVLQNMEWLTRQHGDRVELIRGDIRDAAAVENAVSQAAEVYHLAAQVAVTTSLRDPVRDFEINARGTLNVLEAIRRQASPPPLIFTSTNKVYGALEDIELADRRSRCTPVSRGVRRFGIDEMRPLDFHSPYGCSKGAADQYVRDYARSFGLRALVFRMSCIYGPHQQGNEDQGWVAHFLICARDGSPVTVFGDGLQVRDVLFVDDLVDAFLLGMQNIGKLSGRAFNIGGGSLNTLSLLELLGFIEQQQRAKPAVRQAAARTGDQRYFVSNTSAFSAATGWHAKVGVAEGLRRLTAWLSTEGPEASTPRGHQVTGTAPALLGAMR